MAWSAEFVVGFEWQQWLHWPVNEKNKYTKINKKYIYVKEQYTVYIYIRMLSAQDGSYWMMLDDFGCCWMLLSSVTKILK